MYALEPRLENIASLSLIAATMKSCWRPAAARNFRGGMRPGSEKKVQARASSLREKEGF